MKSISSNLFKSFHNISSMSAMGGGESGGSVVQYTPQGVATEAGSISSAAARAAGELASQSIGTAIQVINSQYNRAATQLKPYTQEGVQALNQLNQYLQLDAYNPGKAPKAPVQPTLDMFMKSIGSGQVDDYIAGHTTFHTDGDGSGYHGFSSYGGVGAHVTTPANNPDAVAKHEDLGQLASFYGDAGITGAVRKQLATDAMNDPFNPQNLLYNINNENYQNDLESWQYANDQYNKYHAEGPFTSEQISDKISNLPGYQAQLSQGIHAIDADASAKGYLGSGKILKELNSFGQNTLSTFYGNTLSQLASLAGMGQQASSQLAGQTTQNGNAIGQQFNNLGTNQANSALASGNALAQALIAGNQQFKVEGQSSSGGGIGSALSGVGSIIGAFL